MKKMNEKCKFAAYVFKAISERTKFKNEYFTFEEIYQNSFDYCRDPEIVEYFENIDSALDFCKKINMKPDYCRDAVGWTARVKYAEIYPIKDGAVLEDDEVASITPDMECGIAEMIAEEALEPWKYDSENDDAPSLARISGMSEITRNETVWEIIRRYNNFHFFKNQTGRIRELAVMHFLFLIGHEKTDIQINEKHFYIINGDEE